jgi:hypothetical protein
VVNNRCWDNWRYNSPCLLRAGGVREAYARYDSLAREHEFLCREKNRESYMKRTKAR